jgi:sigma-B regulation protein RsbU (phosphoserine phosphatase)
MSKNKILVADDNITIQIKIAKAFEQDPGKYSLVFVSDCKCIVQFASEIKPDLLFVNLTSSEKEGLHAISKFKKSKQTCYIPIIAMSSNAMFKQVYEAGADDFIAEPFDEFELLMRVRKAIFLIDSIRKINEQNDQLKRKNDELSWQHQLLAEKNKEIIDDINYSLRIQNALLPSKDYLNQLFIQHFVFFRPRNIVSGDFYWVYHKENKVMFAAADCTGHGISGAFMTVAGAAFLNEIASMYDYADASEILNQLRNRVMRLLHQKGEDGETNDGMDISLCVFDFENYSLQFAGANNPLYIVRQNGNIDIIKPDKLPIGIHINFNQPFTTHRTILKKGDMIYLFSDGYPDQFGGPNDQKYRYKRLQDLFVRIHNEPVNDQKKIIEQEFNDWIGERKQVDDIMMIGIRIV